MNIEVRPVDNRKARQDFLRLPQAVYRGDSRYVPGRECVLAEGVSLVVYEDDLPVARCCARMQTGGTQVGTIGSFEALRRETAVRHLLEEAVRSLVRQGAQRVVGPMDGDTWHNYRFNTGPFESPPFIKEPWNPPWYPELWKTAGFTLAESYVSYRIDEPAKAANNQERFFLRCLKQGYTFAPITDRSLEARLPALHALSCRIFAGNILYTPLGLERFAQMYRPAGRLLQDGLSWMALAPDGTPAGFIFTFPDYAEALRSMKGGRGPAAGLRFLLNKRKARRTCIKTLGVIPEKRGSGLTAALTFLAFKNSVALGYEQTLMCLMHSSNDSRKFGGGADRHFRSYELYEFST